MRLLGLCGLAFVVGLSGAMMPGPLLAVTIAQSAKIGFSAALFIVLGHAILEFALVVAVVSGLGRMLRAPVITRAIGVIGGAVLLLLAQGMIHAALSSMGTLPWETSSQHHAPTVSAFSLVGMGIWVSLSNPYWVLWWATVGMTFLTRALSYGWIGPAAFAFGHVSSDAIWYLAIGIVVVFGRKWMTAPIYNGVILLCALFLIGLGMYFLLGGLAPQLFTRSRRQAKT